MRPKPMYDEKSCGHDWLAQAHAFSKFREDERAWFEECLADPRVQRILDIPTKGPVFILDARDVQAPETIDFWLQISQRTVSKEKFEDAVKHYREIIQWQTDNPDKVKIPD